MTRFLCSRPVRTSRANYGIGGAPKRFAGGADDGAQNRRASDVPAHDWPTSCMNLGHNAASIADCAYPTPMLYDAYQAHTDRMLPAQIIAEAALPALHRASEGAPN